MSSTEAIIEAAKSLIDALTFDDSGINGQGGNGGMIDRKTIHKANLLRIEISKFENMKKDQ